MNQQAKHQYIFTVRDRCRLCYACIRECPAKAIKIESGQAAIIESRCIVCGSCVKVCGRNAKMYSFSIDRVKKLLREEPKVAAIVAPSIAAEFTDIADYKAFVGMIRALGFHFVNEVAFAAELVAHKYQELLGNNPNNTYITTCCPSIVSFVEKHHTQISASLAPIVSPMIAMAKVLKTIHGENIRIVFIGPCIAKKGEIEREEFQYLIDEALSFVELRRMFSEKGITQHDVTPSEFDPPLAGKGAIFPISGGMLQTVDLQEDFVKGEIVVAEGRQQITGVLKEFEEGHLDAKLFDLLCCNGCIQGPGMSNNEQFFNKRKSISNFTKRKFDKLHQEQWKKDLEFFRKLDLSRTFAPDDQRVATDINEKDIRKVLMDIGKNSTDDELNCGACGYDTCYDHAVAILNGNAEIEMCLPHTIIKLHNYIQELDVTNKNLESTRAALKQSEKLASMGQLAAGIAHEVNNPLGVIIMYSHILLDEVDPSSPLFRDMQLIVEQADRCKKIIGGLLNFARRSKVYFERINVNLLVKDSLRAVILPTNVKLLIQVRTKDPMVECDHDQMVQVLSNLFKNAIEAMPNGGTLKVVVEDNFETAEMLLEVTDTGTGITQETLERMFEPFYTTKTNGQGTGLGLPIIYGIVKMHRGNIKVETNNDPSKGATGSSFIVTLPRKSSDEDALKNQQ